MRGDRTIYICVNRKFQKIAEPVSPVDKINFLITYQGRDWSGFRTLDECLAQLPEIEAKPHADLFEIVERL